MTPQCDHHGWIGQVLKRCKNPALWTAPNGKHLCGIHARGRDKHWMRIK